jgi:hypothetical protein
MFGIEKSKEELLRKQPSSMLDQQAHKKET